MYIFDYAIDSGFGFIPVLNILGILLKDIEDLNDKYIPLILCVFGILFTFIVMDISINAVIQGVLMAGASVYIHQIYKQLFKK